MIDFTVLQRRLFKLKFKFNLRRVLICLLKEQWGCGRDVRQLLTFRSQLLLYCLTLSYSGEVWVTLQWSET